MSTANGRILVVDDEAHILHVVRLKLENAGYDVITAADGEEGYEVACEHRPDLIITDHQMPYMTGLEMCARLRSEPTTAHIPVLLVTAQGYGLDRNELDRVGIAHAISKPFSPRDLLTQVASVLAA